MLDAAGKGNGAFCQLSVVGGGHDAHRAGGDGRRVTAGPAALGACARSICGNQSLKARAGALLAEVWNCRSAVVVGGSPSVRLFSWATTAALGLIERVAPVGQKLGDEGVFLIRLHGQWCQRERDGKRNVVAHGA